jgi:molybdopterin converting factor small subunit
LHIHLEFLGVSRLVAGTKEILLEVEEGTTFQDIVRMLSKQYPGMVGNVIQPNGEMLHPPNIFNLNARQMIPENQMHKSPNDGDRIILMSMSAGG